MSVSTRDTNIYLHISLQVITLLLIAAGLFFSTSSLQNYWSGASFSGFKIWLMISASIILLCRFIIPAAASLTLITTFLLLLYAGNGLAAGLSCLFFCMSVFSLGRLLANGISNEKWNAATIFILGFSSYVAIFGIMIHLPINYRSLYIVIILAPLLIDLSILAKQNRLKQHFSEQLQKVNRALSSIAYWKLSGLLTIVVFFSCYSFMSSITSDDNSYHLAMWSQLQSHHHYLFDIKTQIWYAAPFTLDMIHGVLSVIASQDTRGALNISMMVMLLTVTAAIAHQLFPKINILLLSLAFVATTPMLYNLLLGLQTELILATLATTGVYIGINQKTSFIQRSLGVILISCLLIAIKLPTATLAAALYICLLISEWNNFHQIMRLSKTTLFAILATMVIGLAIALHPYVNSYVVTGNPVFPLYNAIFKSPYYNPINFKDNNFTHGASLQAWWAMFFDSSKYLESKNFIVGFQYLFLPFAGILCLSKNLRLQTLLYLALPMIMFGGCMFYMVQYVRYLFPVMPIACILAGGVFYAPTRTHVTIKNSITSLAFVIFISLNLYFLPGVSWLFDQNPLKNFTQNKKLEIAESYNPEYVMNVYLNEHYPRENVLFDAGRCNGAALFGKPFYPDWISPSTLATFDKIQSDKDVVNFLQTNNIHFIYWYFGDNASTQPFRPYIKAVIDKYGKEEMTVNKVTLYKIML